MRDVRREDGRDLLADGGGRRRLQLRVGRLRSGSRDVVSKVQEAVAWVGVRVNIYYSEGKFLEEILQRAQKN